MIGGMVSSTLLTLIVIPSIYAVVKGLALRSPLGAVGPASVTSGGRS
jgi:Cu(I)/Ag(I) efflux system membrane protein CusA/SilA